MKKIYNTRNDSGVALIIVLSLMAILAVLAIAFSKSMRNERLSARNYSDQIRAKHFIHVGLSMALTGIATNMLGYCYPEFGDIHPDAFGSTSTNSANSVYLLAGQASKAIPRALWADASNCASYWTKQINGVTITNGRIAYLVVNCSGLLDANYLGGSTRLDSTSIRELDPYPLSEIYNANDFYANRDDWIRFETLSDISSATDSNLNSSVSNLFFYSYDPDRDEYFTITNNLGTRYVSLTNKFWINKMKMNSSSYDAYSTNSSFMTNYFHKLTDLITKATETDANWPSTFFREHSTNIAWNIINYIDTNSIPQTGSDTPWLDDVGCEATPLINEIVLTQTNATYYRLDVELWYPFVTNSINANDGYTCEIAVFTNPPSPGDIGSITDSILNNADISTITNIATMTFGGTEEFLVCSSPEFFLTNGITNNSIWFLARVLKDGQVVDQAIGEDPFEFTNTASYSVNDPRFNSQTSSWVIANATLGNMNENCDPWADGGQGLPIYHRDGEMKSIGEIGHIHIPDSSKPWHNISLTNYYGGAAFINWMTVRETHEPARGLVHISTRQEEVLEALFYNTTIGYANTTVSAKTNLVDYSKIKILVDAITNSYDSLDLREVFSDIGFDQNFKTWKPYSNNGTNRTGDLREDALRSIVELITFRQNIFTIIIAAQALAPDGKTVLAEKRAIAIVFRDSYTGKSFVRSFRWLTD